MNRRCSALNQEVRLQKKVKLGVKKAANDILICRCDELGRRFRLSAVTPLLHLQEGIGFWIQEIPRKVARALNNLWISWAKPVRNQKLCRSAKNCEPDKPEIGSRKVVFFTICGAKAIGELLKKNSIFRTLELNNNLIDYS
ncbi:hypothetical protein L2E82_23104 [Cichorium intybus]|uniref:Uncharacterized protein n=1 Tax=Cichorium intybus TaxID=13427 RepID=A0ACB9E013_CICIN|nr:hypothetical protein L2E82_23104 [Cichorium intybus]